MSVIAKTLASLPGVGKAFGVGELPIGGQATSFDIPLPRDRDPANRVGDGQGTSIVQAVLNWYITTFAEAVLQVTQPDPETGVRIVVPDHELVQLLETPNAYYGGDELLAGMIISDIIDGNSYVVKLRNQSTRVVELWWIPHTLIEPKGSPDPLGPFIEYYEYRVSGRRYEIPSTEIIHIRHGLDPANPRKGMSRLKGQIREIMTDEEAARFTAALIVNMGVPGLVVSPKGEEQDISEPNAALIKAKLDQGVGSSNRGRTVVLSGATELHEYGFSPEQLTLRDVRSLPEERVCAATGVPAAVVGFGTGLAQTKVGATMRELREMAAEQGLVPMWRRFGKALHRQLMHEFQTSSTRKQRLEFYTSDVRVLQEDKQKKHERTREDYKAGVIDGATAQGVLGYKVDESRRTYLQSALLVERPVDAAPLPIEGKIWEMKLTSSQKAGLSFVQFLDRGRILVEDNHTKALEHAFDDLGQAAASAFSALSASNWDFDAKAKISKKDALESTRYQKLVDKTMRGISKAKFSVAKIADGVYAQSVELVIKGYGEAFDISLSIGERDLIAERVIKAGGKRVGLTDLSVQTKDALFRSLAEAKREGLGMPQTARKIREHVTAGRHWRLEEAKKGSGVRYRAETIARTESRWAVNRSVAEVGKTAGFTKYVAFDDRIGFGDDECMARDGDEADYDEMVGSDDHPRGTLSWSPVPRSGPSARQTAAAAG